MFWALWTNGTDNEMRTQDERHCSAARSVAARLVSRAPTLALGWVASSSLMSLATGQVVRGVPAPVQIAIRVFVLLSAVIVHEVSHGLAAEKLGDPTARRMGRLTLNPIPHIDIFGSVIIPGFLILTGSQFVIGWAKPVPVDIRRFKDPLRDFAITALAGPVSNGVQTLAYAGLFRLAVSQAWPPWVAFLAVTGAAINLFLGVFNLVPIPPLDGSRLVAAFLPVEYAGQYLNLGRFGFILIFGLLYMGLLDPLFNWSWRLLVGILT